MKFLNESEIKKNWMPIVESTTGIKDEEKLGWISQIAHNQKIYEENVSLNPGMNILGMGSVVNPVAPDAGAMGVAVGSGDNSPSLLGLAIQTAAMTIALDLVPVVPMNGPTGLLSYMDTAYAGGVVPGSADSEYALPVGGVSEGGSPLTFFRAIVGEGQEIAPDTNVAADADHAGYEFVGLSRIDGVAILKRTGDIVQGTLLDDVDAALGAVTVSRIELVKTMEDHIAGFSGKDSETTEGSVKANPYSRGEGEATQGRLLGLTLFNKAVVAETFQVDAAVTREQIQDLKQHGVDAVAQVKTMLLNEVTQSINKHILGSMYELAEENRQQIITKGELSQAGLDVTIATESDLRGGEELATQHRRIATAILAASNLIANRGRRGAGNFAVVGAGVASALQSIAGFMPYPFANTMTQTAGSIYPLGSIFGVNVYVDPNLPFAFERVLVGRKGDANSPGLVFMPYIMADTVETIAEGSMSPRISMKSRYALVEAGHHPHTMYISFNVNNFRIG